MAVTDTDRKGGHGEKGRSQTQIERAVTDTDRKGGHGEKGRSQTQTESLLLTWICLAKSRYPECRSCLRRVTAREVGPVNGK